MDMAPHPTTGAGETRLGPSCRCAYTWARKEEVTLSSCDAQNISPAVGVLTLLEGRPAHTRDTPHTPTRDIGPLESLIYSSV